MSNIKILHTGDLHLSSSRTGIKNGRSEILNTFFKITNLCKTEEIDFLLIAGDLFDSPFVSSDILNETLHAMEQIPDTIIAIAPGNHDCVCPGSVYLTADFPENVVIFTPSNSEFLFPQKGVRLLGAAFADRFERKTLFPRPSDSVHDLISIGVIHGELTSESSESDYNPITLTEIADSGFDYLALGHIHKRSAIKKVGKTFFSYCGCPDGRGFDEIGSQGIYIGTVGKEKCSLTYLEMSSRKYICDEIDVSDCSTSLSIASKVLKHLSEKYAPDFDKNLYQISLIGVVQTDFFPHISQIEATLENEVAYISIADKTEADLSDISHIANESSLRGLFVQKILQRQENADESEKELYMKGLRLGLRAFEKGVTLRDN